MCHLVENSLIDRQINTNSKASNVTLIEDYLLLKLCPLVETLQLNPTFCFSDIESVNL